MSRQHDKGKTQTGQLEPRTLLQKRYVIEGAIGRGGMAAVYKARDTRRGKPCAIKEMSLSTVQPHEQDQAVQNFLAEARMLSSLDHPNLPAFTDFFTQENRHFLVMEYIDGSTLDQLLEDNRGPFSERRVLGWARQLCDVLEYLHGQKPPIIFRDLKPANIMLTRTGRIKLIDFGIARLFRNRGAQDTQLLGTPGFAPPEQYGSAQTDERSDIYSLAMTLFQLMTDEMNEQGFGLKDIHRSYPQISSPVARVLEKATSLKPEERYENIVLFRRALLGIGTFRFENGGEATTPDELADLCAQNLEEAADYLLAGEIDSWLQEIGESELARAARRIRQAVNDPDEAIDRFIRAVEGPASRSRTTRSRPGSQAGSYARSANSQGSRAVREPEPPPTIVVEPKTIDFGQVYPGLSAPILLSISGSRGAVVSGTIQAVESWINVDRTTFDGARNPVNVRVDSTRMRGSTHYTGTIMVTQDETHQEVAVTIEVDVLGYTTTTIARKVAKATPAPSTSSNADADEDLVLPGTGRMRMAPQATVTVDQPLNTSRATEYKNKYGPPNSGGWEPLLSNPSAQNFWTREAITFTSAFMLPAFLYVLLDSIGKATHVSFLVAPWFTAMLLSLVPLTVLGVIIVNWLTTWRTSEATNRIITSLVTAFVALGLGETAWQSSIRDSVPPLHLIVMLILTALAATSGATPQVSQRILDAIFWGMRRMRWVVMGVAMLLGGALGFALTSGLGSGCFAPFGILLGAGVGFFLVMRVDRLMKQKPHP